MAYRLKDSEGMASGLRRIARKELEKAGAELAGESGSGADEAVHETRKHLKKARAVLRLARADIGNGTRRAENDRLRAIQGRLSGPRDAQVLLETLAALCGPSGRKLPQRTTRKLRDPLRAQRDRARDGQAERRAAAIEELADARARVEDWPLTDETFDVAAVGLRRIYRDGRSARDAAERSTAAEAWHEWRKRVKDLWYAARILQPAAPVELGALVDQADTLADLLGDHNDLAVLRGAVAEHGGDLTERQAGQLLDSIDAAAAARRRRISGGAGALHQQRLRRSPERAVRHAGAPGGRIR